MLVDDGNTELFKNLQLDQQSSTQVIDLSHFSQVNTLGELNSAIVCTESGDQGSRSNISMPLQVKRQSISDGPVTVKSGNTLEHNADAEASPQQSVSDEHKFMAA